MVVAPRTVYSCVLSSSTVRGTIHDPASEITIFRVNHECVDHYTEYINERSGTQCPGCLDTHTGRYLPTDFEKHVCVCVYNEADLRSRQFTNVNVQTHNDVIH